MFKMWQSVLLQLVCVSLIVSHYCNDGLKQSHQISLFRPEPSSKGRRGGGGAPRAGGGNNYNADGERSASKRYGDQSRT